jgi:hypothetical protein
MGNENKAPSLKDVLGKELNATGFDIPEGSYQGCLFAFGEPFMLKVAAQFQKPGQPDERAVMELWFGVKVKDQMQPVAQLVGVPEGGAANKKSNLYKALKALKGMDPKFFDKEGNFAKGVNLEKFLGAAATVQVKKNAKDFPQVDTIVAPMDGVAYPKLEDCKGLHDQLVQSDNIPF